MKQCSQLQLGDMINEDLQREKAERIQWMKSPDELIGQIIEEACHSPIKHKTRITVGYSNEVYDVTTQDGQAVILRIHWFNTPYFENEKWALNRLANEGLPIPSVLYLAHNLPGDIPRSACVETKLSGQSLETMLAGNEIAAADLRPLLFNLGQLLRKVHAVSMDGFGPIQANGKSGPSTWREAYVDGLPNERAYEAAHHVGLPKETISETIDLLSTFTGLGNHVAPCLLHGDFNLQNVLIDNGQISGLLDFEFCAGGDPAKEVPLAEDASGGWHQFFGRQSYPQHWVTDGYFADAPMEQQFGQRMFWFKLANSFNGFAYHGVNDKDNNYFMNFLRQQLPKDLSIARDHLK